MQPFDTGTFNLLEPHVSTQSRCRETCFYEGTLPTCGETGVQRLSLKTKSTSCSGHSGAEAEPETLKGRVCWDESRWKSPATQVESQEKTSEFWREKNHHCHRRQYHQESKMIASDALVAQADQRRESGL